MLFRINQKASGGIVKKYVIGIDLGGTKICVGACGRDRKLLWLTHTDTEAKEGREHVLNNILKAVSICLESARLSIKDIGSVGIGVPGPVNYSKGVLIEH